LSEQEERELHRIVKASSERRDVARRARALLSVAAKQSFVQAAGVAGFQEARSVGKLVKRFNAHGLAALSIAAGRGGKPIDTSAQQARILAEVQRTPDRKEDQTATWSLALLRKALRATDLPHIANETIRRVLHESGSSFQRTRTWCRTGYALRKRKSGTVTVYDLETPEKKDGLSWRVSRQRQREWCSSMKMKPDPLRPSPSREPPGNPRAIPLCSRMSTSVGAPPNC
jgi:transposase